MLLKQGARCEVGIWPGAAARTPQSACGASLAGRSAGCKTVRHSLTFVPVRRAISTLETSKRELEQAEADAVGDCRLTVAFSPRTSLPRLTNGSAQGNLQSPRSV